MTGPQTPLSPPPPELEALRPFESGQWHGFSDARLVRPGHESRLALLGGVLALVGFCLPLVQVRYAGQAALSFSGPDLLAVRPLLWLVPALAGLAVLVAVRDPERGGRFLIGLLALAAAAPVGLGLAAGYAHTPSGLSEAGFFGTLGHLRSRRQAAWEAAYRRWKDAQEAPGKVDLKGLKKDDLGDLGDEEDKKKEKGGKGASEPPPPVPVEPRLAETRMTAGFFVLLLGLLVALAASWPWLESGVAWAERVALVLLLAAIVVLSSYIVARQIGSRLQWSRGSGDIAWMDKVAKMSVIWIGLIGASLAARERGHIAIEILERAASRRLRRWVKVSGGVFAVVVLLLLAVCAVEYLHDLRAADLAKQLTQKTGYQPALVVPRLGWAADEWVFALVIPVGLLCLALRFALLAGQDLLGSRFDHHFGVPR